MAKKTARKAARKSGPKEVLDDTLERTKASLDDAKEKVMSASRVVRDQSAKATLRWVPFLMAVGIGLSINNARAVFEALRGQPSEFKRTPKYNLAKGQNLSQRRYRSRVNADTWIELLLAVHFAVASAVALATGLWGAVPFLLLFEIGFGYTALTTWAQSMQRSGVRS